MHTRTLEDFARVVLDEIDGEPDANDRYTIQLHTDDVEAAQQARESLIRMSERNAG